MTVHAAVLPHARRGRRREPGPRSTASPRAVELLETGSRRPTCPTTTTLAGRSASISADRPSRRASIGTAPADDILASWTGSVYVFSADADRLDVDRDDEAGRERRASGMYFGWSVSLALPYLVVGTKGHGADVYTTHDGAPRGTRPRSLPKRATVKMTTAVATNLAMRSPLHRARSQSSARTEKSRRPFVFRRGQRVVGSRRRPRPPVGPTPTSALRSRSRPTVG